MSRNFFTRDFLKYPLHIYFSFKKVKGILTVAAHYHFQQAVSYSSVKNIFK